MSHRLVPSGFEALPGWAHDDPSPVLLGMQRCAAHLKRGKRYRTGSIGLTVEDFAPAFAALAGHRIADKRAARVFFEQHFTPVRVIPENADPGFVTGYYEPEIAVSAVPTSEFRFPFYGRPADLVDVDESNRPEGFDPSFVFGRRMNDGTVEYPDRAAIETGFLDGRGLEIAYAASRVDVFFAHIQGAARLVHADGCMRRITYAAKSGHPFTAVGRVLIDLGEIPAAEVTMARLRQWLAEHPDRLDEILWRNRSFIFFREAAVADIVDGPIAAAKVPLIAGRSLAVDRAIHTFGTPFYVDAPTLRHVDPTKPFRRLMIAHDTGSAILGPARGDIFTGSGEAAGDIAGAIKHAADFYMLVPNAALARLV